MQVNIQREIKRLIFQNFKDKDIQSNNPSTNILRQ